MAYPITKSDEAIMTTTLHLTGNISPDIWIQRLLHEKSQKPYWLAVWILSDVCYWYSPTEVRDEKTGAAKGYAKKYKGDLLQRSYADIMARTACEKKEAQRACKFLSDRGLIKIHFRTVVRGTTKCPNVMFIEPKIEAIRALTYSDVWTPAPVHMDTQVHICGHPNLSDMDTHVHTNTITTPTTTTETTTKKKKKSPPVNQDPIGVPPAQPFSFSGNAQDLTEQSQLNGETTTTMPNNSSNISALTEQFEQFGQQHNPHHLEPNGLGLANGHTALNGNGKATNLHAFNAPNNSPNSPSPVQATNENGHTSPNGQPNATNLHAINGEQTSPFQPNGQYPAFQANRPQQHARPAQATTSRFEGDLSNESIITANNGAKRQERVKSAASSPTPVASPTVKRQVPKHLQGFEAMNGNTEQAQIAQHLAQKLGGKPSEFVEVALEYNGEDNPLALLERVVEVALFMRGNCKPVAPKKLAEDATRFVQDGYTLEQAKWIMAKDGQYRLEKKLRDDPYPSQIRTWLLSNGTLPTTSTAEQGEVSQRALDFHAKYVVTGMPPINMPVSVRGVFMALGVKSVAQGMLLTPAQIQSALLSDVDYGL